MIRRPCSSGSRAWSSRPEPKSPEGGRKYPCLPRCPCPSRQQAEEKMARSRQREEGPPLARFLRGNVSTKGRRDCPLDFLHAGGGILPPCPTADAPRLRSSRSTRASILSPIYRSIDETPPPETSQPPYGKACGPPSGAPDEGPQQKGRSLYGSVPCSFISCFPSPRFQPAGATGERWKPEGRPLSCVRQRGLPAKYISYDVGGTMGSPYIFQVSGR